jgi:excisionase family DNA binding protein
VETQEQQELITLREAARIANVSYQTVWRAAKRDEFPALRVGPVPRGAVRVEREAFERWLYGPQEAA